MSVWVPVCGCLDCSLTWHLIRWEIFVSNWFDFDCVMLWIKEFYQFNWINWNLKPVGKHNLCLFLSDCEEAMQWIGSLPLFILHFWLCTVIIKCKPLNKNDLSCSSSKVVSSRIISGHIWVCGKMHWFVLLGSHRRNPSNVQEWTHLCYLTFWLLWLIILFSKQSQYIVCLFIFGSC